MKLSSAIAELDKLGLNHSLSETRRLLRIEASDSHGVYEVAIRAGAVDDAKFERAVDNCVLERGVYDMLLGRK
jgi:hypothetical protein